MKILRFLSSVAFLFALSLLAFYPQAQACNAQENCTVRGPNYPCPTMRNPFRTCPSYFEDPICQTRLTACRGKLALCVTSGLVAHGAGAACISCLVAGTIATGYTGGLAAAGAAAACLGVCAVSATAMEQIINSCPG
jgi:hypothetical protein